MCSYLDGGPLILMMPLHVNENHDDDHHRHPKTLNRLPSLISVITGYMSFCCFLSNTGSFLKTGELLTVKFLFTVLMGDFTWGKSV